MELLKGQLHEIFDLWFFSPINPTYGPDSQAVSMTPLKSFQRYQ
jgi:hypothetical protein